MKIKVGDSIIIDVSDGRNYTLYIKQEVLKQKTNKNEMEFVFEGYFNSVEHALEIALKRQAFLNNKGLELTVVDYINQIKSIAEMHKSEIKTVAIEKKLNKKRSDKNGKFMDV